MTISPATPKLLTLLRAPEGDLGRWVDAVAARLGSGVPGASRIVLNTVRPVEVREGSVDAGWNVIVEGWFDTRADAEAARPAFAQDAAASASLIVDEILVHDGHVPVLGAKIIVAFRRKACVSRAQAQAHWRGRHVEVGLIEHKATDFLQLYFQNHVVLDNPVEQSEHDYDGLPEYWLDGDALANVAADAPVMKAIAQDEENFLDRTSLVTMLVEERPVFLRG